VIVDASDAPRIVALDPVAQAAGLAVGERLADARARIGALRVRLADPAADAEALAALARWATRYTPSVALFSGASGNDGVFLDITGAAHLLGGEENLLADLATRLEAFGLPSRLAVAGTPGAAWALSHFARTRSTTVASGAEAEAIAPLPIEALRLDEETARTLRRLGWKRIGGLIGTPRAPFAARFERELLLRLDQALGRAGEPLALLAPRPLYVRTRSLLEPIATEEAVLKVVALLMQEMSPRLEADGKGARALRLDLYRVDGAIESLDLTLAAPTRSPDHVTRLLHLKLERRTHPLEAGFGFETLSLAVTVAEPMLPAQGAFASGEESERSRRLGILLDALQQRLGHEAVFGLEPVASHWPEHGERRRPVAGRSSWPPPRAARPRPPLLFACPEPADVIALVPDGPPQRIRWRGRLLTIAHAEGPERIAAEWWRTQTAQPTRDYYLAEESTGRRLWLYREGLPGCETAAARWFVHGLFA